MMLENFLGAHLFPDTILVGGALCWLVEDVAFAPLVEGDPLLGWEGDGRLAVFICPARGTWELVRYEADGTYTSCVRVIEGAYRIPDLVAIWCRWLVEHDGRRGFNLLDHIEKEAAAAQKAVDDKYADVMANEAAPRMMHALRKDGEDVSGSGVWSFTPPAEPAVP